MERTDKEIIHEWANDILRRHRHKQADMARRTGIGEGTIHRLLGRDKNYTFTPSTGTVARVARAYNEPMPALSEARHPGGFGEDELTPLPLDSPHGRELSAGHNQTLFEVNNRALELKGYVPGDIVLVELGIAAAPGDVVCAQVYDFQLGTADSILRVYDPPYLLTATTDLDLARKPLLIDNERTAIVGVAIRSLRIRAA